MTRHASLHWFTPRHADEKTAECLREMRNAVDFDLPPVLARRRWVEQRRRERVPSLESSGPTPLSLWEFVGLATRDPTTRAPRYDFGKPAALLTEEIPAFLDEHTESGADLWRRLLGRRVPDDGCSLSIADGTYAVTPEEDTCGFLQGEPVARLGEELFDVLPETDEFYRSLDDRYHGSRPLSYQPVELVYQLCRRLDDDYVLVFLTDGDPDE